MQRGTALYNLQKERQRKSVTSQRQTENVCDVTPEPPTEGDNEQHKTHTRRWTKDQCTEKVKPTGPRPIRSSTGRTAMTSSCSQDQTDDRSARSLTCASKHIN